MKENDYEVIEIYFSDLNNETQEKILNALKCKDISETNYDVFPLTSLEFFNDDN